MEGRPTCACHGEPMTRNGHNRAGGRQRWICTVERRQRSHDDYWKRGRREKLLAQYAERKANGVCVRCGGTPIGTVCWDCLNDMEARYAFSV